MAIKAIGSCFLRTIKNSNIIFGKLKSEIEPNSIPYSHTPAIYFSDSVLTATIYPIQYIEKYVNPDVIQNAIDTNPNITEILSKYGIEPKVNMANIDSRAKNHLFSTYIDSEEIAQIMQLDKLQTMILCKAALLHDIGKALIPEEIIQKPGRLTPKEREIVDLHAQLGYEILKTTDIPDEIANAIRTHHMPASEKPDDIISQILSVADVYSALREERVYKPALSQTETFAIMQSDQGLNKTVVSKLKYTNASII